MSSTPYRVARATSALVLTLGMMGFAVACSSDDDPRDPPEPPDVSAQSPSGPASSPAIERLETTVTIGPVAGRLGEKRRQQLKGRVAAVVDAWLDAAYVVGKYPRTNFEDAFPGFSVDAKDDARSDAGLMSNKEIGDRIDSVEATKRRLKIDVLASGDRAVGVTARFVLGIDVTGDLERSDLIVGRLLMIYRNGNWRVFGYDVSRGEA